MDEAVESTGLAGAAHAARSGLLVTKLLQAMPPGCRREGTAPLSPAARGCYGWVSPVHLVWLQRLKGRGPPPLLSHNALAIHMCSLNSASEEELPNSAPASSAWP